MTCSISVVFSSRRAAHFGSSSARLTLFSTRQMRDDYTSLGVAYLNSDTLCCNSAVSSRTAWRSLMTAEDWFRRRLMKASLCSVNLMKFMKAEKTARVRSGSGK